MISHKFSEEGACTVDTTIMADPESYLLELSSATLLILLQDRTCLDLIMINYCFQ